MKLKRYLGNPILKPIKSNNWESERVFNTAAIYDKGLFHLLYRAQGVDEISRIGYAVSIDGYNFKRFDKPVFKPLVKLESQGCEDPRITKIGDKFYMTYTAYSKWGTKLGLAVTKNFIQWERLGIISDNKDGVLFPELFDGYYAMLCRKDMNDKDCPYGIYLAFSKDLKMWRRYFLKILRPVENWERLKIGVGAQPIKLKEGWLIIYHGVDERNYSLGYCILDLKDPSKVLYRSKEPILFPKEKYEICNSKSGIVFTCGACLVANKLYIYYGGTDKVVCVANAEIDTLI